jgi:hypothetical protein
MWHCKDFEQNYLYIDIKRQRKHWMTKVNSVSGWCIPENKIACTSGFVKEKKITDKEIQIQN